MRAILVYFRLITLSIILFSKCIMREFPGGWRGPTRSGHFFKATNRSIRVISAAELRRILNSLNKAKKNTNWVFSTGRGTGYVPPGAKTIPPNIFYGSKNLQIIYGNNVNPNRVILPPNLPKTRAAARSVKTPSKYRESRSKKRKNNNNNNTFNVGPKSTTPGPKHQRRNNYNRGGGGSSRMIAV